MDSPQRSLSGVVHYVLSVGVAVLTGLLAQLHFYLGPIPYTMQCMGVVLAGLLLPPRYSLLSAILYLILISLGLPLAAGFRGGLAVLFGPTGGYLVGFPLSALVMSLLTRLYLGFRRRCLASISYSDAAVLLCFSLLALIPTYVLGFTVFTYYAIGDQKLMKWVARVSTSIGLDTGDPLVKLFIAAVAVFIPQDIFVDSLLAIIVSKYVAVLLRFRGAVV